MAIELVSCPACGRKNASDRTTCLSCGVELNTPKSVGQPRLLPSLRRLPSYEEDLNRKNPREPVLKRLRSFVGDWNLDKTMKLSLVLMFLLVSLSAFYYTVVFLPRQEEARRKAEESRIVLEKQKQKTEEARLEVEQRRQIVEEAKTKAQILMEVYREAKKEQAEASKAAAPFAKGVYLATADTPVRKGPGHHYKVIGKVSRGLKIMVVDVEGEWFKVQSKYGNRPPGYIEKKSAQRLSND